MSLWFGSTSILFDKVQKQNSVLVNRVATEDLGNEWFTPLGTLARVILLDQFPRCIYRGTAQAFHYDATASKLVRHAVENSWIVNYSPIQRFFLSVAMQHSENIADQKIGVEIALHVADGATDSIKDYFSKLKGYPYEHFSVIERFGRFPSRNLALGRESTEEELEWMSSPDCPVWARSQLPVEVDTKKV